MTKQLFKRTLPFIYVGSFLGLIIGGLIMQIAWDHNAQGEIHGDGYIDWSYWLFIGFSWFTMTTASITTLGIIINLPLLLFHRYKNKQIEKTKQQ